MFTRQPARFICVAALALTVLSACSQRSTPVAAVVVPGPPIDVFASIQEIMASIVDPAADGVWDSVGTIVTQKEVIVRQPHTDAEWEQVRHHALTLVEATNLLIMDGRRMVVAGGKMADEGSDGVLSAAQAQEKLQTHHAVFVQFAAALHDVAKEMLVAVDARNPESMMSVGSKVDEVCEACHTTFWYPTQSTYRVTTNLK